MTPHPTAGCWGRRSRRTAPITRPRCCFPTAGSSRRATTTIPKSPAEVRACTDNGEIYSPPYLFKGPRPQIDSSPQAVDWGDAFGVASTSAGIERAVLMAPAATTHGVDMHQRHVELEVLNNLPGEGVDVIAPPSANVAPPGYYMLFLLDEAGVPSVASWIKIDPSAPDQPTLGPPPPAAPPPPATSTVTGSPTARSVPRSRTSAPPPTPARSTSSTARPAGSPTPATRSGTRTASAGPPRRATGSAPRSRPATSTTTGSPTCPRRSRRGRRLDFRRGDRQRPLRLRRGARRRPAANLEPGQRRRDGLRRDRRPASVHRLPRAIWTATAMTT